MEEILAERGVDVSDEAVRPLCLKFGAPFAKNLGDRRGRLGDIWHLDEMFVSIRGEQHYLWRAVDQDGEVLDIRVQKRRDTCAAQRCFHKLLKGLPYVPCTVVTDRLGSYGAACQDLLPRVVPRQGQRLNNRAGVSHQRTRQRERHMRCFKSPGQAQHFLVVHGPINNLFGLGRHLLPARHYRTLRTQAVTAWGEVTGLQKAA